MKIETLTRLEHKAWRCVKGLEMGLRGPEVRAGTQEGGVQMCTMGLSPVVKGDS